MIAILNLNFIGITYHMTTITRNQKGVECAPIESADALAEFVGLRYTDGEGPGFQRRPRGRGFAYFDTNGRHIRDSKLVKRFKRISEPGAEPFWPSPNCLRSTTRSARKRPRKRSPNASRRFPKRSATLRPSAVSTISIQRFFRPLKRAI